MMKWVRSMTKTKTRSEQQKKPRLRFVFTWHDFGIFLSMLSFATILCYFLRTIDDSDVYVALIFELTVVLVSRFTDGYLFGLLSSVVGVIGINYIFTFPYYQLNFTISGYPLTFLVMLIVSVVVSTLTTQIKQQEKIRAEAEKEKMRGNLLRAVSHDIRTPLTSIVGGVSTLLDSGDQLDEATRTQLLENIRDESNWLVSVVENLLSVTRMTGEQTKIKKEMEAGEEVLSALKDIALRENIKLAAVSALGATGDFTVGVFNVQQKQYHANRFQGAYEIVSLTGTVTTKDGEFYAHLHMCAGNEQGQAFGGHLNRAVISATCEMVIQIIDGTVERRFSEDVGLNLFRF